jgi:hypothetical protein
MEASVKIRSSHNKQKYSIQINGKKDTQFIEVIEVWYWDIECPCLRGYAA